MRMAALAPWIPCSSPRSGPTRPIQESLSRLFCVASDWIAAMNSSACLASGKLFSVTLEWPLAGFDRRRLIALSAAPLFGRQREFLGYRGFGVLGEEIEVVGCPGGDCWRSLRRFARERARGGASELGEQAETPVERHLDLRQRVSCASVLPRTDGGEFFPAPAEAFEPESSAPASELGAVLQASGKRRRDGRTKSRAWGRQRSRRPVPEPSDPTPPPRRATPSRP